MKRNNQKIDVELSGHGDVVKKGGARIRGERIRGAVKITGRGGPVKIATYEKTPAPPNLFEVVHRASGATSTLKATAAQARAILDIVNRTRTPPRYLKLTAAIARGDSRFYVGEILEARNVQTQGRTKSEVRDNLADAISLLLADADPRKLFGHRKRRQLTKASDGAEPFYLMLA